MFLPLRIIWVIITLGMVKLYTNMKKLRIFIFLFLCLIISGSCYAGKKEKKPVQTTREYWVSTLDKIARPVICSLSQGKLKETMPIETRIERAHRVAYLEAFGRTFCGISSWLELGPDNTKEGRLRGEYIQMVIKAIDQATNPESKDFMNFTVEQQPLVDAAFFAQGLIRSKTQIWDKLDSRVKQQVVDCLKSTRAIRTPTNNWLLFSGIIEAFLLDNNLGGDLMRIDYAMNQHLQRYKGDAVYGDGDDFHWDYYNSFVIQPMMMDIATILKRHKLMNDNTFLNIQSRLQRYASVLELFISPEGTYPPMGRSLCYRVGVFHALGQVALQKNLSPKISPAQVRCALTAVIKSSSKIPLGKMLCFFFCNKNLLQ